MRKAKMFKKCLVYTLIGALTLSNVTPALAYDHLDKVDYDSNKNSIAEIHEEVEVTEVGNSEVSVYAELGSEFLVKIPKALTLSGVEKKGAYTVSVEGDISGTETIKVVPDETFALSSSGLADVVASITQDKTQWSYNEILENEDKVIGNGAIDASGISAGEWEGTFWFNINLEEGAGTEEPGTGEDSGNEIEVAPDGELSNWSYTLDEVNKTVTLNQYTNTTATDVIVYGKYQLDGVEYDTNIGNNDSSSGNYMFNQKSNIQTITFKEGIDTSNVTNMSNMFSYCKALTSLDLTSFDTSKVTDMNNMFSGCIALTSLDLTSFDTSNVANMKYMFSYCKALTSLDLTGWNTSNVTDMSNMFATCEALTSLDLTSFDTSNVANMKYMFSYCKALTSLDLTSFDTSNVTNMSYMFSGCEALTSLDLTSFDTSKVTDMNNMFYSCEALTSLDLTSFDTSNVTNMSYMFKNCKALTSLDLTSFDTSNVTNMSYMFLDCAALTSLDLTSFDTSYVRNMNSMFSGCTTLTSLDLSG